MPILRTIALISAISFGSALVAQDDEAPTPSEMPERISFLVAFGDEKCRAPVGDEIVVCATVPEGDRYRIPVELRKSEIEVPTSGSWTSAVESLDELARAARPDSCSVNGSGGFTGCSQAALRQWFAERRGRSAGN